MSVWIPAGHSTWVIARRVGHATDKLVQQRYAHQIEKFDPASAEAMECLFRSFLPDRIVDPEKGS